MDHALDKFACGRRPDQQGEGKAPTGHAIEQLRQSQPGKLSMPFGDAGPPIPLSQESLLGQLDQMLNPLGTGPIMLSQGPDPSQDPFATTQNSQTLQHQMEVASAAQAASRPAIKEPVAVPMHGMSASASSATALKQSWLYSSIDGDANAGQLSAPADAGTKPSLDMSSDAASRAQHASVLAQAVPVINGLGSVTVSKQHSQPPMLTSLPVPAGQTLQHTAAHMVPQVVQQQQPLVSLQQQYTGQKPPSRHASVAKPEHAGSVARRRGPMDEMRQLQRILTKLLPRSAGLMPGGADGGGNKVQAEHIKIYLTATLGEAPKPDWGLRNGWGQYLADLFNWATGLSDISKFDTMQCARRQQGRSWEVLHDKLMGLGVYSWNWELPLRLQQVRNCSKSPPQELQRHQEAVAAVTAAVTSTSVFPGISLCSNLGKRRNDSTPIETSTAGVAVLAGMAGTQAQQATAMITCSSTTDITPIMPDGKQCRAVKVQCLHKPPGIAVSDPTASSHLASSSGMGAGDAKGMTGVSAPAASGPAFGQGSQPAASGTFLGSSGGSLPAPVVPVLVGASCEQVMDFVAAVLQRATVAVEAAEEAGSSGSGAVQKLNHVEMKDKLQGLTGKFAQFFGKVSIVSESLARKAFSGQQQQKGQQLLQQQSEQHPQPHAQQLQQVQDQLTQVLTHTAQQAQAAAAAAQQPSATGGLAQAHQPQQQQQPFVPPSGSDGGGGSCSYGFVAPHGGGTSVVQGGMHASMPINPDGKTSSALQYLLPSGTLQMGPMTNANVTLQHLEQLARLQGLPHASINPSIATGGQQANPAGLAAAQAAAAMGAMSSAAGLLPATASSAAAAATASVLQPAAALAAVAAPAVAVSAAVAAAAAAGGHDDEEGEETAMHYAHQVPGPSVALREGQGMPTTHAEHRHTSSAAGSASGAATVISTSAEASKKAAAAAAAADRVVQRHRAQAEKHQQQAASTGADVEAAVDNTQSVRLASLSGDRMDEVAGGTGVDAGHITAEEVAHMLAALSRQQARRRLK